jgi:DNA-directed RNA polymerase subunit omega
MARVTVEDCVKNIPNRFGLVLVAASRAKKIAKGSQTKLPAESNKSKILDKPPVFALREIAHTQELSNELESEFIASLQRVHFDSADTEADPEEFELDQDWSDQIAQLSRELESLGTLDQDEEADLEDLENDSLDNNLSDDDLDEDLTEK